MDTKTRSILWYTVLGVVFGCMFPIMATVYYVSWLDMTLSYESIIHAQTSQPLLWIIGTAPIFLGIFAAMAGINKSQEEKLRIVTEHIQGVNDRLETYGKKFRELSQNNDVVNANIDRAFPRIINTISEIFYADGVAVWLEDKNNQGRYNCSMLCDFSVDGDQTYQNNTNLKYEIVGEAVTSLRHREFLQLMHLPSKGASCDLASYVGMNDESDDCNITAFPVITEGRVVGIICCRFSDLSREWQRDEVNFMDSICNLAALLLCANDRNLAEDAYMAKSQFLAVISHELRTPLNIISGYNDLILKKAKKSDSHHEHSCEIRESALDLNAIIDDILDMAKMETGAVELEKTPFSLSTIIDYSIKSSNELATAKNVSFGCNVDKDVPLDLIGDEYRIRQVLFNILCNAFKFTEKGKVELNVSVKDDASNCISLRFDIIDTGVGIKQERLMKIFDPFTQASNTLDREHGGTGLGLGICKKLTDLMGGEIGVNSVIGEGSHFWIEIPFKSNEVLGNKS